MQPGPRQPPAPARTYTLQDMAERSLLVLATRRDIACVLVNPLQALHPNANAPGDSSLIDGSRRSARQGRLHRLAQAPARGLHRARHRADL